MVSSSSSSSSSKVVVSTFQKIQYRLLGPTTAHLEYEFYLLTCMILLVVATVRGLYKESSFTSVLSLDSHANGTTSRTNSLYINGDYVFLLMIGLVLSRHVIIRICCTNDRSTHISPNLFGLISHLIQGTIFALSGHTFDRSPPPIQLAILHHYQSTVASSGFGFGGGIGSNTSGAGTTSTNSTSGGGGTGGSGVSSSATLSSPTTTTPTATERMIQATGGIVDIKMNTRDTTKNNPILLSLSDIVPSSFIYALQIPRKLFWFPLTRIIGTPQIHLLSLISHYDSNYLYSSSNNSGESRRTRNSGSNSNNISNLTSMAQWPVRKLFRIQQYLYQIVFLYAPSSRLLLSTWVVLEIIWYILFVCTDGHSFTNANYDGPISFALYIITGFSTSTTTPTGPSCGITTKQNLYIHTYDVKKMLQIAEQESASMIGYYVHQLKLSYTGTVWLLVGFGVFYSLIFFTRIAFPLPDLLANSKTGKDTNSVRSNPGSTGSTTTSSGKKSHHHNHHSHNHSNASTSSRRPSNVGWLSKLYTKFVELSDIIIHRKSTNKNTMPDVIFWIRRQYNAISSNRLHASIFVVLGRVAENVIIVGVLPRTRFACRVMGHCSSGLSLSELSRVLFPGGLNTPKRIDGIDAIESIEHDLFSATWTVIAVVVTSSVLLLAQTIVLNRSYISMRAYHSLEWEIVPKDTKKHQRQSDYSDLPWISNSHHQSSPDVWDGRRKYLKGEEVYYPDWFGALYRARVNSPESHPKANTLRYIDEQLSAELGHPATSQIIASLASIQFVLAVIFCFIWLISVVAGAQLYAYGLVWAIFSCLIAVHGVFTTTRRASYTTTSKSGDKRLSPAMKKLQKLHSEIVKHNC